MRQGVRFDADKFRMTPVQTCVAEKRRLRAQRLSRGAALAAGSADVESLGRGDELANAKAVDRRAHRDDNAGNLKSRNAGHHDA